MNGSVLKGDQQYARFWPQKPGYTRLYLLDLRVPDFVHHAPVFVHFFVPDFIQTERLLFLAKVSPENLPAAGRPVVQLVTSNTL